MKTYSYDPSRINKNDIYKMRFELGDTAVEGEADTCILCDEEYETIISKKKSWKNKKIECLKSIIMRLSYEVNYQVGDMKLELSDRCKQFKEMLKDLEKSMQVPKFTGKLGSQNTADSGHYFTLGMQENPYAKW